MIIFCDRLTIGACVQAIRLSWRSLLSRREVGSIQVLDPLPDYGCPVLLRIIMQRVGFRVEEAKFFAGHLRMPDGQAVYLAARSASINLAFRLAERILTRSKLLAQLNHKWGRNTIFKHIARSLEISALQVSMRFMVAEALGHAAGDNKLFFIVQRSFSLAPDLMCALSPSLKVYFYGPSLYESLIRSRTSVLYFLLFEKLRKMKWLLNTLIGGRANVQESFNASEASLPSLLVLQEDDLSLDCSYRTQPHWLFSEDGKPPFQTIVLKTGSIVDPLPVDNKVMKEQNIISISQKEMYLRSRRFWSLHPIQQCVRKDFWKCALISVFGSSVEVEAAFVVARLLYIAIVYGLAAFCEQNQVKAFMTCENYMIQADAMQLIAPALGITTLSYQYSNMGAVGPLMMTTADIMLTFAPLYHQRWSHNGIRPGKLVDMGYLYDTSFDCVRQRASEHTRRLADAGAQFVICYFDESVQTDKYGLISEEDLCTEISTLLRLVLSDPSIGLVVKTQFQRNSPQNFDEIASVRAAAKATGRYIELKRGNLRNIIFPAEAALSADIAIGHAVGATAPLEAALTGVRSIILNPYGIRSGNDVLYAQANIVYPSMIDALEAIRNFRAGAPEHAGLGDWSPIIDQFDPFQDGNAGHRFRNLLDQVVLRDST